MKRAIINLFSILFFSTLCASPGCMDNSWHLERPYDNKEYHIVTHYIGDAPTCCQCPCRKLSLSRGECLDCGHRHDVQPWTIVRYKK